MSPPRRNAAIAIGAALTAVVIGGFWSLRQETPTATPAPSAAAASAPNLSTGGSATPTAAATATAAATPVASARYGYIVIGQSAFDVRTETGDIVQTYGCGGAGRPCDASKVAVSPDGRRIAFWSAQQLPTWRLFVLDIAPSSSQRAVADIAAPQIGGTMVWSTDSLGVLYATVVERTGGPVSGPARASINALDLTTGQTQMDVMPARSDGTFYLPLAWDRSKRLFSAVRTGEGGYVVDYDVADPSGYRTSKPPESFIANQLEASPDAQRVLAVDRRANVVRIWPVGDASRTVDVGPGPGRTITVAHWMPDSRSVAWSLDTQFGTFIPQTESSRIVYAASGGAGLIALRPDGTGALLQTTGGLQVTDMQSGASTRVPLDGQILPRGIFLR